jgi:hypothetical protein
MTDALSIERRLRLLEETVERLRKGDTMRYVEDTYTPTMTGESVAGVTTYTTQVGAYIRLGNVVHAVGYVVWTGATGTGNMNISLPFTARSTANLLTPATIYVDGITFASGSPMGLIVNNTAFIRLYYPASNAATTIIPVEAAGQVAFHAAYLL